MEMINNITNNLNGYGQDLNTLINGVSPIQRIADGIASLQRDQFFRNREAADKQAILAWKESEDYKTLSSLVREQNELTKNTSKNFWTKKFKNQDKRDELDRQIDEIVLRNTESDSYWYSGMGKLLFIESTLGNRAAANVPDLRLSHATIFAILLTIQDIENKSFDDILKIVNKYVSK